MKAFFLAFCCLTLSAQVSYDRIAASAAEPGSWLTYSGNYSAHRYSALKLIDRTNVARLKPAWMYQTNDLNQFETTPIVADGVMYISEPPSNAAALDLHTGRPLWIYRRAVASDVRACCGQVNRGLAIWGKRYSWARWTPISSRLTPRPGTCFGTRPWRIIKLDILLRLRL